MPVFSPAPEKTRRPMPAQEWLKIRDWPSLSMVPAHSLQPAAWQTPPHIMDLEALANLVPITVPGEERRRFAR